MEQLKKQHFFVCVCQIMDIVINISDITKQLMNSSIYFFKLTKLEKSCNLKADIMHSNRLRLLIKYVIDFFDIIASL